MKNRSWFYYLVLALLVILMILVANFSFKTSLPSGRIDIQLVPVVAVAILGSFGFTTALLAGIAGTVILLIMHWLSWPDLLILVIDWLVAAWIIKRHPQPSVPQGRLISITTGLTQVVAMTVIYLFIGWQYTHQLVGEWGYLGQMFPVALLSGLLYALLTAPLIAFIRWLLAFSDDSHHDELTDDDDNSSIEVDLSSHHKDDNNQDQNK